MSLQLLILSHSTYNAGLSMQLESRHLCLSHSVFSLLFLWKQELSTSQSIISQKGQVGGECTVRKMEHLCVFFINKPIGKGKIYISLIVLIKPLFHI